MSEKGGFTRRNFIKSAALFSCGASMGFGVTGCASMRGIGRSYNSDANLPNIILITADDLGWKDLGCYGNSEISTPNIDCIAAQGVRFTNAFVVSSSCAPSRASFITGQYPHTNGVDGLTHIHKLKSLNPFHTTLPEILSQKGYNTALEGKWHVSPYLPTSWYGYNERLSGMLPKDMWIKDTEKTLEFIRANKDNRFYLEVNYMNNHRDAYGEFHFDPQFPVDPAAVHVPEYWTLPDWNEIRLEVAKFYSQTMRMDQMIGEILAELDKLGLAENTFIMFVSDNGPPFPGNKMTLYERGTGVPLIMRWPAKIPTSTTIDAMLNTIDIMPTLLDAAQEQIPREVQGKSFLDLATGQRQGEIHEAVFTEMTYHVHYLPTRAARTRKWKYIRNYSDIVKGLDQNSHMDWAHRVCELPNQPWKKPRVPEELYDLAGDPHEQTNLAADPGHADILDSMQTMLDNHMRRTNDPYLGKPFTKDFDPELYTRHPAGEKYK